LFRVCFIGHYNLKHYDEGVRNVGFHLAEEMSNRHEVLKLDIKDMLKISRTVKKFNPEIIHYILSPTLIGLISAKFFSALNPSAKSVISAPNPGYFPMGNWMSLFRPDLVLVQSRQSEMMFKSMGYKTKFLPNGVDIEKFVPVSESVKKRLRDKYNVDRDKFVVLHVGSIEKGRNLKVLKRVQEHGCQVIVVGSTTTNAEEKICRELKRSGCLVWIEYFRNIEEIYALSDAYIFPVNNRFSCIEMPLSILEAMSCNLPVISTRFGALPRIFHEGGGLFYLESEEDIIRTIELINSCDIEVNTRRKVLPYSWENVAKRLETIYCDLMNEEIQ